MIGVPTEICGDQSPSSATAWPDWIAAIASCSMS